MITDAQASQWCEGAVRGDQAAAAKLLRTFYPVIFAYFRRLTGNDADAADLVQVTFVKVWQSLARFEGRSSVSTWMHRIAYCNYVDWRRRHHPATEQADSWWQNLRVETPDPAERAAEAEAARQVYAQVERLEEELRQIIHLHYYQGLSLAETAGVLEIPASTLKYRLRNALDQLRQQIVQPAANPLKRCLT